MTVRLNELPHGSQLVCANTIGFCWPMDCVGSLGWVCGEALSKPIYMYSFPWNQSE
jgi:hypothetical protein